MSEWIFLRDEDGYFHRTNDEDYASWLCEECGMTEVNCDMTAVDYDDCQLLYPATDEDYQEFLKGGAEESDDIDAE